MNSDTIDVATPIVFGEWQSVHILRVVCPYCGGHHTHGAGGGRRPWYGHRVADCRVGRLSPQGNRYYVIDVAAAETLAGLQRERLAQQREVRRHFGAQVLEFKRCAPEDRASDSA